MSGTALKALEQLAKVSDQCNDLGNPHMKYKFWLIFKILFRRVTLGHGYFSANVDLLCGQDFQQVPSRPETSSTSSIFLEGRH